MRAKLIGVALAAALAAAPALALSQSKTSAEGDLRAAPDASGQMEGVKVGTTTIPDFEPIAVQLERVKAETERRAVLRGARGPFAQAMAAWQDKEWPPLIYAVGTLLLWGVGLIVAIWAVTAVVRRARQQ